MGDKYNNSLQYATFYIPFALAMCLLAVFAALSIFSLLKNLQSTRWKAHMRLTFFIVWVICVCLMVAIIRFYIAFQQNKYDASLSSWKECKLYKNLGAPTNSTCDTNYPPERINPPLYMSDLILGVGIGVFGFATYGLDSANFRFWVQFCTLLFAKDWGNLRILIMRSEHQRQRMASVAGRTK